MNKKLLFLSSVAMLLFFVAIQAGQAIGTYSYSATNFQINTGCSGVVGATPSNLTTRGDIVKISGTGFGNRDIDDATPEMVYVSTSDGLLNIYRGLGSIDGVNEVPFGLLSWTDSEIIMEVRTGLGNTLGNYVILRTYPGADGNQSECVQGALITVSTTPPVCTSFTYSDWGSCTNGQQTRTVLSSDPSGCNGGTPVLTQSCTPQCTISDYSCTDWNACSSSGTQTRTCNKVSICDGGVQMPATSQSCTYTPLVCTSWTYSDWGVCSTSGQQTRSIVSSSPDGCAGGTPVLSQSCTPTPSCTADTWTCGEWNACSAEGSQSRTCSITADCPNVSTPSPSVNESCVYNGPNITSISPNIIYAGTSVTLNGSKFMNLEKYEYSCYNCKVLINDKEMIGVLSWYNWYDDKVSLKIPSDAQSGYIQVQDSKGNRSNKFNFTVSQDPATIPAVITSISPKVITPGDIITILGTNFGQSQGSSNIMVGGSSAYGKILSWTDTEIKYQTSVSWDNNSRKIGVSKCKDYWTCLSVVYGGYFYIQPQITSLDFSEGREGMKVTIFGKYLKNSNVSSDASTQYFIKVYFNGVSAFFPQGGIWTAEKVEVFVPKGAMSGTVTLEIIADNTNDTVTATGPNFKILEKISNDEFSDLQLYLKQINLPQAWGLASNRRMITVAVIDDGVYNNHPDLKNKMWENDKEIIGNGLDDDNNGYIDDRYGWNFITSSSDVTPLGGHGTQVAGIIGAETDNEIGITGVNRNVKLMPLIVCAVEGCIDYSKAIHYAVDNGAEVINLSFVTRAVSGYTTTVNDAIDYAYQHNVLIVTAAGNGDTVGGIGFDLNQIPQSPICNNDQKGNRTIGVGAVDAQNFRTQWSNYGSCVDIWAPGIDVASTAVPAYNNSGALYLFDDGTSFSAPIITGIVSLLKATYPTITSEEVINLFINNSNSGVVDAYKTLSAYFQPANKQVIQNPTPSNNNQSRNTGTETKKIMNPSRIEELLPAVGAIRNENDEIKYKQLIESDANAYKVPLSSDQKTAVTNFVTYGISEKTKQIGSGERRALVRDYFETVGRGEVNWSDMENLVNGQKVVSRNLDKERSQVNTVQKMFKKIFGHDPVFTNPTEDLAWNTMMYRIRFPRDLEKEKASIGKFQAIFKQSPKSPFDWATVRALGYVKK